MTHEKLAEESSVEGVTSTGSIDDLCPLRGPPDELPSTIAANGPVRADSDDEQCRTLRADAGEEIKNAMWQGTVDALAVDLYDDDASAPVLDSEAAYADCRALLTEDGIMTVNLFGRSSSFDKSLNQMAEAFGEEALWAFRPTREGNTVVLAQRTPRVLQGAELEAACDRCRHVGT